MLQGRGLAIGGLVLGYIEIAAMLGWTILFFIAAAASVATSLIQPLPQVSESWIPRAPDWMGTPSGADFPPYTPERAARGMRHRCREE